uniref:G-protein coupled receptors family 1 profile domain-containing protein n=1 Tax=Trichobilharzia regenti TaxID=157069 RepID=A0AA85JWK8_TRIRE|nr:unnamed protein product [Trichobilharzia regenti]
MSEDIEVNLPTSIIITIEGILGTIFNMIAVIVMFTTQLGSNLTMLMLRAQIIIDFTSCFTTTIYYVMQFAKVDNKLTGLYIIDMMICHLWFRNAIFWLTCILSVQNLVCISFDRVRCVIFKNMYKVYTFKLTIVYFVYMVIMACVLYTPSPLLRRYAGDHCEMEFLLPWFKSNIFLNYIVYSWILFAYVVPVMVMITSHIWVIRVIRKSHSSQLNVESQNAEASVRVKRKISQLVITTAIMSGQQIILHLYECVYQTLIVTNLTKYRYETVTGQMSTLLILLSSVLNPCVLVLTTSALRKHVLRSLKIVADIIKWRGRKNHTNTEVL